MAVILHPLGQRVADQDDPVPRFEVEGRADPGENVAREKRRAIPSESCFIIDVTEQ